MKIITVVSASLYGVAAAAILFAVHELSEAPSTLPTAPAVQSVPSSVAGSVTGAPGPAPIPSTVAPDTRASAAMDPRLLPDPVLTPGAVRATTTDEVCVHGYTHAHRVWHNKWGTLARYGIPHRETTRYQDDDLIPVCLGGDNADPLNHWPQPRGVAMGAEDKDKLERLVCIRVCADRDDNELRRYQSMFAHDWISLWREEGLSVTSPVASTTR